MSPFGRDRRVEGSGGAGGGGGVRRGEGARVERRGEGDRRRGFRRREPEPVPGLAAADGTVGSK